MNYDTAAMTAWLTEQGGRFLGKSERALSVSLEPYESTLLARLTFRDSAELLTIKQAPISGVTRNAEQLFRLHARINAENRELARSTPVFFGYHEATNCIAMEYIPGPTLLHHLKAELRRLKHNNDDCDPVVVESAAVLAEFNRLSSQDVGLPAATRANSSFVAGMESFLEEPFVRGALRSVLCRLRRLIENLRSDFLGQIGDRVLVVDAQAKNILLPELNNPVFIDIQYGQGPAALNVGSFLAAFDRLALRCFSPRSKRSIEYWKRLFVQAYCCASQNPNAIQGIYFFYIWVLIQTMRQHARQKRIFAPYLAHYYARVIKSLLNNTPETILEVQPLITD